MMTFPVIQSKPGSGAGFMQGDTLVLKVVKRLADGMWQVRHNGRLFVINSEIPLRTGAAYRTQVYKVGSKTVLRLLVGRGKGAQVPATPVLQFGVPEDSVTRILIQALQNGGLKIDMQQLAKARAVYTRLKKKGSTSAGLLVSLISKGFEPDSKFVETFMGFLEQHTQYHGDKGQGRQRKRGETTAPAAGIEAELRSQIENFGEHGELLHLFNHIKAQHENWIVIPYRVSQEDDVVSGTIRFRTGVAE